MPGRWMLVGIKGAYRHDLLDLRHTDLATHGGGRVEVAGGLAEDQVAGLIGFPGFDDGKIGEDAFFQDIRLAVEVLVFLALGH